MGASETIENFDWEEWRTANTETNRAPQGGDDDDAVQNTPDPSEEHFILPA